jgi:hypothetical protein
MQVRIGLRHFRHMRGQHVVAEFLDHLPRSFDVVLKIRRFAHPITNTENVPSASGCASRLVSLTVKPYLSLSFTEIAHG